MRRPGGARTRTAVGALAAVALVAACAGGASRPGQLAPGGELCYRIVDNEASRSMRLPWGFALAGDPAPLREPGGRLAAATLAERGGRSLAPFASWRLLGADSVQVGPLVTGSVQLRLAVEDGRLQGLARPIGDAVPAGRPLRPAVDGVVAERMACPASS